MQWWKWLGVAGMAGVAATGVVVARNERQRRAYSPDDVRARLHERAAAISDDHVPVNQSDHTPPEPDSKDPTPPGSAPAWWSLKSRLGRGHPR